MTCVEDATSVDDVIKLKTHSRVVLILNLFNDHQPSRPTIKAALVVVLPPTLYVSQRRAPST